MHLPPVLEAPRSIPDRDTQSCGVYLHRTSITQGVMRYKGEWVAARQFNRPSLTPLFVADRGHLQLVAAN